MNALARFTLLSLALLACVPAAVAEPVKLRLAYFSSDRTTTYLAAIKPFVDAVNAEGGEHVEIEVNISGALGKNPAQQLQLVLDGTADMAFIVPGYTPARFPDNMVIELPGIFRNLREATLVHTRLAAANVLQGYNDLVVLGAFASEPESIHTRTAVNTLDDLKGLRIRANNSAQNAAVESLGMVAVQMPINQASSAISSGKIDGSTAAPAVLIEFGISRVAAHHYLLGIGAAPLALVMNRQKFDGLPKVSQDILRKFGSEWTAERYIATYNAENIAAIEQLKAEPNRKVVTPSQADRERTDAAFSGVIAKWLSSNSGNRELLTRAEMEIFKIRSGS
jgi:TRAP-type C4-dicarboxylate transport system substrate-binding protein